MYESHPSLPPPAPDARLWRYMDFARLLYLLETGALFFPRITALDDPYEGHLTRPTVGRVIAIPDGVSESERSARSELGAENLRKLVGFRSIVCVSCWHQNDVESAAMWALYLRSGEGIAVRTTFARFVESIPAGEPRVSGGMVKYVDYETYEVPYNIYDWVIIKRKSFEHEREFRAVLMDAGPCEAGVAVPVDVNSLIESVFIAPSAAPWFADVVRKVVARYGVTAPVIHSELLAHPGYLTGQPHVA